MLHRKTAALAIPALAALTLAPNLSAYQIWACANNGPKFCFGGVTSQGGEWCFGSNGHQGGQGTGPYSMTGSGSCVLVS